MKGVPQVGSAKEAFCRTKGSAVGSRRVHVGGKTASWAWFCGDVEGPALFVMPDKRALRQFVSDWVTLCRNRETMTLPELPLWIDGFRNEALRVRRGEILEKWRKEESILTATPAALMTPFRVSTGYFPVVVGKSPGRDALLEWLASSGYERADLVWHPGQFVSRGSIVDVFDPAWKLPHRVEFFDDRIESLRLFRTEDQRSITPMNESLFHGLKGAVELSLSEIIPETSRVILCDPDKIEIQADAAWWLLAEMMEKAGLREGCPWSEIRRELNAFECLEITGVLDGARLRSSLGELPDFRGDRRALWNFIEYWKTQDYRITVCSRSGKTPLVESLKKVDVVERGLSEGFMDHGTRHLFLADGELYGVIPPLESGPIEPGPPVEWDESLQKTEYVVHEEYGVAKNKGIDTIVADGMARDCLILEFADNRRLLVPLVQLYKILPYYVPSGDEALLDNLGGRNWKRSVKRAREQARESAEALLALYAKRETLEGFRHDSDGSLTESIEANCPFSLTADQAKAIEDIKGDMEHLQPMDRLLIGDVGFGKTEVALRAAVKVAENGRQVLFLVPTTLLAEQHMATFSGRCDGLPIRVEMLSRFVPSSRQRAVIEDVARGRVDILIGTHRLLQKDLQMKDLGLVIIDEEHRFGVFHKEYAKFLHPKVDVLSITATPIPRTLHMAMGGLRDVSILAVPPHRKRPVLTSLGEWDEGMVRQAVKREIERGGQIFFVHNRIGTIEHVAARLRGLFPDITIDIAHGRMNERQLEKVMHRFRKETTKLLICTTIIESGLDLPNVNTLIVDEAQDLGLAQMYQLRGRIGRREEQAFCFLFYPSESSLTPEARERLEAVSQMTEVGSGYKLARRDLEIRGGGQLIGTRQHGRIERVGFTLYYRMLEEEVAKLKGEDARKEVPVDFQLPLRLPASYIPQSNVRVTLFRRLLRVSGTEEVRAIEEELKDRFGPVPDSVKSVLALARLRVAGKKHGIEYVRCSESETVFSGVGNDLASRLDGRRWYKAGDGRLRGPGGYRGMVELDRALKEAETADTGKEDVHHGEYR
ncbi:MAG: DEAD/DEAH box helicase [Thermovirgaceae bacterium]